MEGSAGSCKNSLLLACWALGDRGSTYPSPAHQRYAKVQVRFVGVKLLAGGLRSAVVDGARSPRVQNNKVGSPDHCSSESPAGLCQAGRIPHVVVERVFCSLQTEANGKSGKEGPSLYDFRWLAGGSSIAIPKFGGVIVVRVVSLRSLMIPDGNERKERNE